MAARFPGRCNVTLEAGLVRPATARRPRRPLARVFRHGHGHRDRVPGSRDARPATHGEPAVHPQRGGVCRAVGTVCTAPVASPARLPRRPVRSPARAGLLHRSGRHQRARRAVRVAGRTAANRGRPVDAGRRAVDPAHLRDLHHLHHQGTQAAARPGHQRRLAPGSGRHAVPRRAQRAPGSTHRPAVAAGAELPGTVDVAVGRDALHLDDVADLLSLHVLPLPA